MGRITVPLIIALIAVALAGAPGDAQPEGCFPGTGSPPAVLPYRCFLPMVVKGGQSTPVPPTPPACTGLEQEPNDTHTDATPFVVSCFQGSASWDGDPDWYRVDLCSGPWRLTARLTGPAGANLDLYLYADPPGWPIAASEEGGSEETIAASGLVTGTYYILVQPAWGSGAYTLSAEVQP